MPLSNGIKKIKPPSFNTPIKQQAPLRYNRDNIIL